jgi:hypothetical protein
MRINKLLFVMMALMLGIATSPAWAKKPAVNDEGMELVKDSKLATVYADPGADLSIYKRIWLQDATVVFRKNWQRHQNQSHPLKVRTSDMEKIQEEVATVFREVFSEELIDGGYELVEQAGEDVLLIEPAIVDFDVYAPDITSSSNTMSFSQSAGAMTLNIELIDSNTNHTIAKGTDRIRDYERGYVQWRNSVSNRVDAKRMMTTWAKALGSMLDEARNP